LLTDVSRQGAWRETPRWRGAWLPAGSRKPCLGSEVTIHERGPFREHDTRTPLPKPEQDQGLCRKVWCSRLVSTTLFGPGGWQPGTIASRLDGMDAMDAMARTARRC